jgi:hypothetical protein
MVHNVSNHFTDFSGRTSIFACLRFVVVDFKTLMLLLPPNAPNYMSDVFVVHYLNRLALRTDYQTLRFKSGHQSDRF